MADYVCDDCIYHESRGGKCHRYERECPFAHFDNLDDEGSKLLTEALTVLKQAVTALDEAYERYDVECDYELSLLNTAQEELEEKTSKDLLKEWERIKS